MSLDTQTLKRRIQNAIRKMPVEVTVMRHELDELNEPKRSVFVAAITGHYYKSSYNMGRGAYVSINTKDAGRTVSNAYEKLIVIADENSSEITVGDFFTLKGVTYEITDLGDNFGIYYDFSLDRR